MDGVVEIITDREWRRRWSREAKLRLVAEHAGVASLLSGANTGSSHDSGKAAIGQPAGCWRRTSASPYRPYGGPIGQRWSGARGQQCEPGCVMLLSMITVEKFGQHQPLNRWAECYAREGVPLSLSTVADQVSPVRFRGQGAAGGASVPLANASNAVAKIAEVLCLRARRSGRRFPRPPFLRSSFDSGSANPVCH
jgi:hypothetical protein